MKIQVYFLIPWLISQIFFWQYWLEVYKRFGIRPSISQSHLEFPQKQGWKYTVFMWGLSVPMLFLFPHWSTVLMVMFLCIDGAARTGSGDRLEQFLHNFGAEAGMTLSLVVLAILGCWVALGATLLVAGWIYWRKPGNETWWGETVFYVIPSIALFFKFVLILN